MKPLTISVNYYNQADFLAELVQQWAAFPAALLDQVRFVIVDDGSLRPAADAIGPVPPQLDLQVYRILPDIPYNMPGTVNLAAAVASTPWVLRHDLDHVLVPRVLEQVLELALPGNHDVLYRFQIRFTDGRQVLSPSAHLITLDWFWKLGGFDEDFSGAYGFDDTNFLMRAGRAAGLRIVDTALEFSADERGATDFERDYRRNQELLRVKETMGEAAGEVLRFPWRRVV
jgi:hypothetical protein